MISNSSFLYSKDCIGKYIKRLLGIPCHILKRVENLICVCRQKIFNTWTLREIQ